MLPFLQNDACPGVTIERIRIDDLFHFVAGTLIYLPTQGLPFDSSSTQAFSEGTLISTTPDCVSQKSPAHFAILISIDTDSVVFPEPSTSRRAPKEAYRVTYFPIVSYSHGNYPNMDALLDGRPVGDYHLPVAHSQDIITPPPFPTDNTYSHPWGQVVLDCEARRNPIARRSWIIAQRVQGLYPSEMKIRRVVGVKASFLVIQRVWRLAQELSSPALRLSGSGPSGQGDVTEGDSEWIGHEAGGHRECVSPYTVFGGGGEDSGDWDVDDYDEGEGDLEWFNSFFSARIAQDAVRRSRSVVAGWQERNARRAL
ncbi:uncharacterized protein BT62DRAFT_935809 [Guyanagaster necrorhizus]|uniref:Uncharacterized protein n=1 Tax=Guyanagaster necrorhizus TaxID=856835 RepID=A0A9P8APA4_9AGAR|nr:uncharacterized protein BT62DRAFT_935809 [Guyanagaster necrorhizus MCA 3950]KAG7442774.1 hypothetical protein BT62DRAFT_935809 [Guyanagaster necrorhizus MCA 3950]